MLTRSKNGGCGYHELLFGNSGPPTKSPSQTEVCVKISCQSRYYCQRYGHLKILQIWLRTPIPAPKIFVLGDFNPQTLFFVIKTPKRHILWRIRVVSGIHRENPFTRFCCRRRQEKKERKGKVHKVTSRLYSAIWGADPAGPISTKMGMVVGVQDVIIHSNFGYNIFRGFRSIGGQNFRFPIDFAGHCYNSADTTAQPVIRTPVSSLSVCVTVHALTGAIFI